MTTENAKTATSERTLTDIQREHSIALAQYGECALLLEDMNARRSELKAKLTALVAEAKALPPPASPVPSEPTAA